MKTCGTCKHWGEPRKSGRLPRPGRPQVMSLFRECKAVPYLGKYGEEEPAAADRLAIVADVDDSGAELSTRADFGCVLHEPAQKPVFTLDPGFGPMPGDGDYVDPVKLCRTCHERPRMTPDGRCFECSQVPL